jgi:hypothetical protein
MIDAEMQARIYSNVLQGGAKEESAFVTDEETGAYWDKVANGVEGMRGNGYTFEIPFDMSGDPMAYFGMADEGTAYVRPEATEEPPADDDAPEKVSEPEEEVPDDE